MIRTYSEGLQLCVQLLNLVIQTAVIHRKRAHVLHSEDRGLGKNNSEKETDAKCFECPVDGISDMLSYLG